MFEKLFRKKPAKEPASASPFPKVWLEMLEERFGQVSAVMDVQCGDHPKIRVFYFDDLPEKGYITAVTCGLSEANRPEWRFGKPELIVTMQSDSRSWGFAAGFIASSFFGEKRFSYGDMFKLDDPISEEGAMNAYLLFAPSFLKREQASFVLPDRTIHLIGLYPVHEEEIAIYDSIGLEAFWHADGFEMVNPCRAPIQSI